MPNKKTAKIRTAKSKAPRVPKPGSIPAIIYAQASPHSQGGVSMFAAGARIDSSTTANFNCDVDLIRRSVAALQEAGFQILQISAQTINIAGNRELFEQAFNTTITAEERPVIKPEGKATATFLECPTTEVPGLIDTKSSRFGDLLEGVALEEPRNFMATSMFPPLKRYWHG